MTENERELLGNLRALADEGPRQAPAHVRERLLMEFRKRSVRKRRMVWFPASGIAAIAAALVLLVAMPRHVSRVPVKPAAGTTDVRANVSSDPDSGFYPLPEAEGLPPVENATVIRVQMSVESLQSMGLDVNGDNSADPVEADVLVGQDGLARAVRFVE